MKHMLKQGLSTGREFVPELSLEPRDPHRGMQHCKLCQYSPSCANLNLCPSRTITYL